MGYVSINGKVNTDYGLDFLGKTIDTPKVKTKEIAVPLRDGVIDLTETLDGVAHYDTRQIDMRFEIRAPRIEWAHLQMELANEYHGKIVELSFSDDSDHLWTGRASVSRISDNGSTASINITVTAEPFRRTVAPLWRKVYASQTVHEQITLASLGHARGYITINNATTPNPAGGGTINWTRFSVTVDGETFVVGASTKNPSLYLPVLYASSTITIDAIANAGLVVEIVGGDL